MKKLFFSLFMIVLMGGAGVNAQVFSDGVWGSGTHYIVFEQDAFGEIVPIFHQIVDLSAPMISMDPDHIGRALEESDRNQAAFIAQLLDGRGAVRFQRIVHVPTWLRGEFHGEGAYAPIDGYFFPLDTAHFVVRVPVISSTILQLWDPKSSRAPSLFDLDALPLDDIHEVFPERGMEKQAITTTGPSSNRVDLLIMGDGYTSAQSAQFATDAANVESNFFNVTPLLEYQNYFNVTSLFTASSQSGADHPPYNASCSPYDATCCADPQMLSDPLANTMVNTAFDANYCSMNIHRLLVVDYSKIFTAAAAVPDWDNIMVIVNDTTYGGSGGGISVLSTHASGPQIAQHEFGHSFANLADEYDTAYPGYPACSDISGTSPCEENVTDETVRAQIKWNPWILPTTLVPTVPEWDPSYVNLVGLFEGARYQAVGMYRPGQYCMMYALGQPYCDVPEQSIILKLYHGGWGVPVGGISMIEPGSTSPASSQVNLTIGDTQLFSATVLSPSGGPSPLLTWYYNGVPVAVGTNVYGMTASVFDLGTNILRFEVSDQTTDVHASMAGGALVHSYVWTVTVSKPFFLPLVIR
jgi:hypothetical protein